MNLILRILKNHYPCLFLVLYIWYKERCFTKRINSLEFLLRKAVKFWKEQKDLTIGTDRKPSIG